MAQQAPVAKDLPFMFIEFVDFCWYTGLASKDFSWVWSGFGVLTCIFVVFWEQIHRICRALVDSCCLKHIETPSAAWGLWTFAGRAGGELLAGTEPKKAGHLAQLDCIRVRPRATQVIQGECQQQEQGLHWMVLISHQNLLFKGTIDPRVVPSEAWILPMCHSQPSTKLRRPSLNTCSIFATTQLPTRNQSLWSSEFIWLLAVVGFCDWPVDFFP